jgi:hypothetical protein
MGSNETITGGLSFLATTVAILAAAHSGFAQAAAPASNLRDQLVQAYPVTVMAANGIQVLTPGTLLLVQREGIQSNSRKLSPVQNLYEDGKLSTKGLLAWAPSEWIQPQSLSFHERVYLVKFDVRDDSVVMVVQTCGSCDPSAADPAHKPRWASVQFKLVRGFLTATDLKHVEAAISSLLARPNVALTASAQAASQARRLEVVPSMPAAAGQQSANPLPVLTPPPPPDSAEPSRPTLRRLDEPQSDDGWRMVSEDAVAKPLPTPIAPPPPANPSEGNRNGTGQLPGHDASRDKGAPQADIEVGWSRDKVASLLGQPSRTEKTKSGEVCVFGRTTVTFNKKGEVAAVVSEN